MNRQQIYTLLIAISAALILGRIVAIDRFDSQQLQTYRLLQIPSILKAKEERLRQQSSDDETIAAELDKTRRDLERNATLESPMLSGNDRSRWCTIRALVEPDLRVVRTVTKKDGSQRNEYVWYAIDHVQTRKGWDTIDMCKHELPDQPGPAYLYSTKPPLLPTLMAIPYAAIYWGSGQRISLENEPYLVVRSMLVLLNLIPLVFCWGLLARLIDRFGTTDWGRIFAVGFVCFGTFMSTFAVTLNNHLPGVVSVTIALYCAVRILFDDERRLRYYFLAGVFGAFAVVCELPALSFCVFLGALLVWGTRCAAKTQASIETNTWKPVLFGFLPGSLIVAAAFFVTNYVAHQTLAPAYSQKAWYSYTYEREGRVRESYWDNRVGIDNGEPSQLTYMLHTTVGHHGVFSLTPVWLLSFAGLGIWLSSVFDRRYRFLALTILATSVIVYVFYLVRPQVDRNYGGMCSGLRWMFWFIPLWSVPLVSVTDRLGRFAAGRGFCLLLLAASVVSVVYPWNPWSQPWIYQFMVWMGWPVLGS